MRVAIFHNRYRERGGEDAAVEAQLELLAKAGHEVSLFAVDNRQEIRGVRDSLRTALRTRWNGTTSARTAAFLDAHPCDVAHVHNFFPLLSPSLHHALADRGIPVVQTLHNYRLVCANSLLQREGRACEDCLSRGPWNAVRHGCYRGSRLQTALWADMVSYHRARGTWHTAVDAFTTPSEFARRKLLAGGLPEERVHVVPNPVVDPGASPVGEGAVYVGRLSPEKGVDLLIEAWRRLSGAPLTIVGSGAEEQRLRRLGADVPGVHFAGALPREGALAAIAGSAFVVLPSRVYEVFPMVALEAFASGRAVVAPDQGALAEIVAADDTGMHFESGSATALAAACRRLLEGPELAAAMGARARVTFESRYAPERTLARLETVYRAALRRRVAAA